MPLGLNSTRPPHAVVYQREDDSYDWRLVGANGEIVATSGGQGYTEANDAVEGLLRTQELFERMREVRYA